MVYAKVKISPNFIYSLNGLWYKPQGLFKGSTSIKFHIYSVYLVRSAELTLHCLFIYCRMMTFNNLHKGIKKNCNCFDYVDRNAENTTDMFIRRVNNNPPIDEDFASFYELKLKRSGDNCAAYCHHRGVSMDKVRTVEELEAERAKWREVSIFKPKQKLRLIFRLKEGAGVIWKTPSKDNPLHCELLKSDQFTLKHLISIEAVDIT